MSLIQYGGSIGITSDFQKVPNTTILTPVPILTVGSSQFPSFDIELNISSESVTSGPSTLGYKLVLKYYTGSIITTAHFSIVNVGYVDAPVGLFENFFPSPQQVIEMEFKYGTYDTVAHTTAADGEINIYKNNSLIFSVSSIALKPVAGAGVAWGYVEFGPSGWANSHYISQSTTRPTGYGSQSFVTPSAITVTVATALMSPPFTYPDPENFSFPVDANILEANNFSAVNPATFFASSHWLAAHAGAGSDPLLDAVGRNALNGAQTWVIAAQMLDAPASGYFYNITASPFTPHTIVPPPTPPPVGSGDILVRKIAVSTSVLDSFTFTTVGLNPGSFILTPGESQLFEDVVPGSGYGVTEAANPNYSVAYTTSNGSAHTNLLVTTNTTTILYVTNTFIGPRSGIYFIHPEKTNDTLFDTITSHGTNTPPTYSTVVVAIPNPFILM